MPATLRPLRAVGHGLLMAVGLQVVLGILALVMVITRKTEAIPLWEVVFTSLHQVTGAVLLATSVLLAAWWRRLTVSTPMSSGLPAVQA
jgi:ABC-type transport system involved in multi-copper enzyme maturation permease subunit